MHRPLVRMLAFVAVSVALATVVFAQDAAEGKKGKRGKRPDPQKFFAKLDANGDGSLSYEEFAAGPIAKRVKEPEKLKKIFAHIDADGDGKVTLKEFQQAREKRQQRAGGKKGKRGPGGKGKGKGKPGPGGKDKK